LGNLGCQCIKFFSQSQEVRLTLLSKSPIMGTDWSVRIMKGERMEKVMEKRSRSRAGREKMAAKREEILEAATQLFAEQGFAEALTQTLADRLKIGKGTIFRHFPTKRELFLAAADRVMLKLNERVDASLEGVEDPLDRPGRAIATYLRFFAENPHFAEMLIQERAYFRDRTRPTYFEHRARTVSRWRDLYRLMIETGRFRSMEADQIVDVVSSAIYGRMFINYFLGPSKSPEVQAEEIIDVIFHGVLSEPERKKRVRMGRSGGDVQVFGSGAEGQH